MIADSGLLIGVMVWVGPSSAIGTNPGKNCDTTDDDNQLYWLHSRGVDRFSTGGNEYYPDYLGIGNANQIVKSTGRSIYETYYLQMLRDVLHHMSKQSYANKVLFLQSCEGTTGDITPYKGTPCLNKYKLSDSVWQEKMKSWWQIMYTEMNHQNYVDSLPNLHLLVNTGITDKLWGYKPNGSNYDYDIDSSLQGGPNPFSSTSKSLFKKANSLEGTNGRAIWRKATNMGHWYDQNYETQFKYNFDSLKRLRSDVLIRDELDFPDTADVNDPYILFAIAASALHSGLDMWMIKKNQIQKEDGSLRVENQKVFDFFNRHVNSYTSANPATAFCVLRKGLDAASGAYYSSCGLLKASTDYLYDTTGSGGCHNGHGLTRTHCIATTGGRNTRGAYNTVTDACAAQGGPYTQFKNQSKYDVGWNIFPESYQINLEPDSTDLLDIELTKGYWSQDTSSSSTQGRFLRDIGNTTDHQKLHFNVSNVSIPFGTCINMVINFYNPTTAECSPWSWKLRYKHRTETATGPIVTETVNVTSTSNGNLGKWDKIEITINSPVFNDSLDGADFWLQNNSTCTNAPRIKFSLIEFYKLASCF